MSKNNKKKTFTFPSPTLSITSDLSKLNEQLKLSNFVFDYASDAITITNKDNEIISVNKALEEITGYKKAELLGRNPSIFSSGKHSKSFYKSMWYELLNKGSWKGEVYNKRKNGEIYPEELSLNTVKDKEGKITHYIAIFRDISERKKTENKLTFLANNEILTGLHNRRYFIEQLESYIQQPYYEKTGLSLLFIDINHFKEVNDVFGHHVGDKTLQLIAKRIKNSVSHHDLVCCYGGDEFAILLINSPASNAEIVAQRLQRNIEKPYQINEISLDISVSIGIAQYPEAGNNANALLRNATQAMANVRHQQHSGVGFHSEELQFKHLQKISLKEKLKKALNDNKLSVYYQPIINASTQKIEKFEALVRWYDDEDGFIPPNCFIPIAEEFGLITAVGQFVLKQACSDLKKLHHLGYNNISFSINRSINEFTTKQNEDDVISQAILLAQLPFNKITIEITETVAMSSNVLTANVLQNLRANGVKIALDDFCTGYSSLSNLIEYHTDFLKIDKSFIDKITSDKSCQILTSTLIDLAKKLDITVIAEGVETAEQFNLLKAYDCHYIQGYYFSPAQPIETCLAMLAQQ